MHTSTFSLGLALQVINVGPDQRLLESLRDCNKLLDLVQKGLSEYLETKRSAFPRWVS
jgi:dynein heavy chain